MIDQLAMMDSVAARELTPDQRARVAENRAAALERRVARLSAQVDGCSGRAAPVTNADASTSIHKELLYAKTHSRATGAKRGRRKVCQRGRPADVATLSEGAPLGPQSLRPSRSPSLGPLFPYQ